MLLQIKFWVNSVLIIFAAQGFIPAIIPVIIIVRDIIVDAIRMNVATKGVVQAAKMSGKIKTACLMVGITLTFSITYHLNFWTSMFLNYSYIWYFEDNCFYV